MIRRITSLALAAAFLGGLSGCKTDKSKALVGHPFPAFKLPASGSADSLSQDQLKGSVSLVVFWATWCPPCREEVGPLREVYDKYRSRGLKIYGLSIDETATPVPLMIQKLSIPYPVATNALPFFDSLGLESIPQIYLLDTTGTVVDASGPITADDLSPFIEKYLPKI